MLACCFLARATPCCHSRAVAVRNRFDHLGKEIGTNARGPCGITKVQDELTSETLYADICHEPDPAREAERARLGLLGRLAARPCLLELYGVPSVSMRSRKKVMFA